MALKTEVAQMEVLQSLYSLLEFGGETFEVADF